MKKLVEHVKTHRKVVHAHLKKHHKKYLFGVLSAALLIKVIPAMLAGIATWHFNYSFADETQNNNQTDVIDENIGGNEEGGETGNEEGGETGNEEGGETGNEEGGETGNEEGGETGNEEGGETGNEEGGETGNEEGGETGNEEGGEIGGEEGGETGGEEGGQAGNEEGGQTGNEEGESAGGNDTGSGSEIGENIVCDGSEIVITYPVSGTYLKSEDVKLSWNLSGDTCSGEMFAIKLYNGNDSGSYTELGTVSANSGEFTNLENFNISGSIETNFAIYLVEDGEIVESLKEGPTFFIDNIKPEIIDPTYAFDPARTTTYGLNDKVNVSFTGSEELTGITVNVLGRNATFVSKTGLKYNYMIQLSSGNNTGQFGYNISFRDLAGNTGYFEYFNSGLTLDTTKPELSGLEFRRISATTGFVSFSSTKPSNITFKYVLSGGKATETLTAQNTTGFRSNLVKARTDKSSYVYKYVITLEDLLGNKSYYAGTFQLSGDSIGYTLVTANGSTISSGTTANILSTLSKEIDAYSGCKSSLKMNYKSIQRTIQSKYLLKVEMPRFSNTNVQNSAELLVSLLAGTGGLSKSSITGLTQTKVNSFQEDLNNYLVIVKMKRDPDVCDANLSILPSLYMSKFVKTLKSYKLIK